MDADRLRAARDHGLVSTDVSSRTHIVGNPHKKLAGDPEADGSGWSRLFKWRKPK